MKRSFAVRCVLGAFWCGASAWGQSVSVDDGASAVAAPAAPAAPAASAAPRPRMEALVMPRARSTPVAYPAQGQGEQEVVLELTLSSQGTVLSAQVISGAAPFSESALLASKSWLFEPARRGERAIPAKIRFAVRFVPPAAEPAVEPAVEPALPAPVRAAPRASEPATQEILVVGQREPLKLTLGRAEVHDMPGAFGDPYRAIEGLPGVVPIVSGLPYFYVRGAPPGNVGYFFDGIPVPYLFHFAAGPGVLHPAFVEHVDLYPGAYPARYGRFAGAIVAGEMAPPSYRLRGEGSVRLIDSGAMLEAPFASGRGSVMAGGRFSYTAAVLSLLVPEVSLSYWDYQARAHYELDARNSVELLAFGAGDFLSDSETSFDSGVDQNGQTQYRTSEHQTTLVDVGFHRLDVRFDHRVHEGNWRNALLLGLDRTGADDGKVTVRNRMLGLRSEYQQALDKRLLLRAGADVLFESLVQEVEGQTFESHVDDATNTGGSPPTSTAGSPPTSNADSSNKDPDFGFNRARRDLTGGAWADIVFSLTPKLELTPGVRMDLFVSGGRVAVAIDPRISARFQLTPKLSVTHGLALVHQAPSFVVPVPGLKPSLAGGLQSALQSSAGLSYSLPAGFESSLAVFQNAFFNMTDLIGLVQLSNTSQDGIKDFRSTGHAYGAEVMIRRNLSRKIGGLLAYTVSRSTRSDGNLEGPATSDRTHVLNFGLSADLGRNWRFGGRWLLYSGIPGQVAYVRAAQAPPRTPAFWRLDFKLQKRWYIKRPDAWWGLVLEVLNTTLNKEVLSASCNAFSCKYESVGPVTIPSIGLEAAF